MYCINGHHQVFNDKLTDFTKDYTDLNSMTKYMLAELIANGIKNNNIVDVTSGAAIADFILEHFDIKLKPYKELRFK